MESTLETCYDIIQDYKDRLLRDGEEEEACYLNGVLEELEALIENQ